MSRLRSLEGCTIIEGHLIIAAMPNDPPADAGNYTFPLLREVTDYVLLYQAKEIVQLDKIFPNLSVIRGNKLVLVSTIRVFIKKISKKYSIFFCPTINFYAFFKLLIPK
jgi:hypothetical protein